MRNTGAGNSRSRRYCDEGNETKIPRNDRTAQNNGLWQYSTRVSCAKNAIFEMLEKLIQCLSCFHGHGAKAEMSFSELQNAEMLLGFDFWEGGKCRFKRAKPLPAKVQTDNQGPRMQAAAAAADIPFAKSPSHRGTKRRLLGLSLARSNW
jgi:hypothetical protein